VSAEDRKKAAEDLARSIAETRKLAERHGVDFGHIAYDARARWRPSTGLCTTRRSWR
jgi:hypothetical protein